MPLPANVAIPDPDLLHRRLRVFAMVDAIVSPEFRSFEFHPRWGRGESVGAFKNGSGDCFFAWFSGRGAVVRGFDHECVMSPFRRDPPMIWPGLLEEFPAALEYALREPAFGDTELTFCYWHAGQEWMRADCERPRGPDPDGSEHVLACLRESFPKWAREYYGEELPLAPLAAVWRGDPLTPALVKALNPDADLQAVRAEAKALGWPFATPAALVPKAKPARKPARPAKRAKPAASKPARQPRKPARQPRKPARQPRKPARQPRKPARQPRKPARRR
jgi:hypothetical protein